MISYVIGGICWLAAGGLVAWWLKRQREMSGD